MLPTKWSGCSSCSASSESNRAHSSINSESSNRLKAHDSSAFIAGLVLVMISCGMTGTPALSGDDSARALAALEELTGYLTEFSEIWQNARQSADALMSLMSEIIMPVVEMASMHDAV